MTYDELGNKGAEYTNKVSVNKTVSNIPEGFVEVTGGTVTGSKEYASSDGDYIFIEGRMVTI